MGVSNIVIPNGKKIPQAFGMGDGRYCTKMKSNDVNMVLHNGNGTH